MRKSSKYQTAKNYAQALFRACESEKALKAVLADMQKLQNAFEPQQIRILQNPAYPMNALDETLKALQQFLSLDQRTLYFLKLIISARHLDLLSLAIESFQHIYNQMHNILEVLIKSAYPLSKTQINKLESGLESAFTRKIVATYTIDPTLLGGLSVQYGDMLLDDTLKSKLNRLEQVMKGDE